MALNAEVHWIKDIGFEVQVRDHHLFTDGKKESGGGDRGPNPKEYLLSGLIGCTGMDVVSLLKFDQHCLCPLEALGRGFELLLDEAANFCHFVVISLGRFLHEDFGGGIHEHH